MATKQIKDYSLKAIPETSDQILIQEVGGTTMKATLGVLHQSRVGFFDYNDLATTGSPITHNGSEGFKKLTNDGLGAFTNINYKPLGMTTLWDTTASQFDFSELSLGDMVDIRIDVDVTTTSPNQDTSIQLLLGIGGSPYTLEIDEISPKTARTKKMLSYTGIYMGDANTLNNPGEFQIDTDSNATITVNGWYLKVTRR